MRGDDLHPSIDPTPGCLRVMAGLAILGWVGTLVILWEIFHG